MGTDQLAYGDDGDDGTITREQYQRLAAAGKATVKPRPAIASKPRRRGTGQRWRCVTFVESKWGDHDQVRCGWVVKSEAEMRRHARTHGVGARFECIP